MKVIYVMGVVRSGTTVLDILLSNHPEIEGVGELGKLLRHGILNKEYCACGVRGNACPFWGQVLANWNHGVGDSFFQEYISLQDSFERVGNGLIPLSAAQKVCFERYARETRELFESIQRVSGKSIIVDSSKDRGRALALSRIPGIELYIIHLVRDVHGVARSLKKRFDKNEKAGLADASKGMPVWRASAQWCAVNLESEWVKRHIPRDRSLVLRYEELVSRPRETLLQIGQLVGCDFTEFANAIAAGQPLQVNHPIAGNRLRMAKTVKLKVDDEWKHTLSGREIRTIDLIAGWMMHLYGYNEMRARQTSPTLVEQTNSDQAKEA